MPTPLRLAPRPFAAAAIAGALATAAMSGCSGDDHTSGQRTAAVPKTPPTAPTSAAPACSPQPCARTDDYPPVTVYISGFRAEKHPEVNVLNAPDGKVAQKITFTWRYENRSSDDLDIDPDAFEFYDAHNAKIDTLMFDQKLCPSSQYKTIQVPRTGQGAGKACAALLEVPARVDMPYGPTLPVR
ncbi:hypothetical protein [Actinomadura opuntiae]|uniref:hypothetical protein n=1 Tax=Actinomadura sp. OS1-43 TaxID=604315 RepID=UPI00255A724A|nr:hypothetical protein [Actinomadura sp. OS1-43]MDL4812833.1 hypothetical protein [Actinomadura sp. OS1-43]